MATETEISLTVAFIDLMFSGVRYSELPAEMMVGLTLEEPSPEECAHIGNRLGLTQPVEHGVYVLVTSEGRRYYVCAAYLTIEENNLPAHQHNLP